METFAQLQQEQQKRQSKAFLYASFVMFAMAIVFAVLMFVWPAFAADSTFSWLPNTETDLAGYKIHYGAESGVYTTTVDCGLPETNAEGRVAYTVPDTPTENTFYVATAYDTAGQESGYCAEISDNAPPDPVQGFTRVVVTTTTVTTIE